MTPNRLGLVAAVVLAALLVGWGLFTALPRWYGTRQQAVAAAEAAAPGDRAERKIKARLFYVSDDGRSLVAVERDVTYAEDMARQARAIVEAQLVPADPPLVSAIPPGTILRAVFIAGTDAYVDLSGDLVTGHPGGSMYEQLTVDTIVSALTANLPKISSVQLLVDGKELDTLAGHVSLSRPLVPNDAIRQPSAESTP
jgi:germination protein M